MFFWCPYVTTSLAIYHSKDQYAIKKSNPHKAHITEQQKRTEKLGILQMRMSMAVIMIILGNVSMSVFVVV